MTTAEVDARVPAAEAPRPPKGMVKKPVRPDFAERDTKVAKLLDKAQEFQTRAKKITQTLDDIHSTSRGSSKQEKLKRELAGLRHVKQQLQKRRENARSKLQEMNGAQGGKSALKKSTQVASADDISEAMGKLQNTLHTTTDPEQQRRIVEQIQKLHSSYEQITGGKAVLGTEHTEKLRAHLNSEIDTCTSELEVVAPKEEALRSRLDQLQAEQQATEPNIQALKAERNQCNEIITQLRDKASEIKADWQERFATFKQQMEKFKAEQDELYKQRKSQQNQEQEEWQTERKAKDLEAMGAPYTNEILRCDQLVHWCRQYKPAQAQEAPKVATDAPLAMDGMVIRTKPKKEDDELLTLSKAKNKKRPSKKQQPAAEVKAAAPTKVQLDMDTLALLSKLRLPVPGTVAEVGELAAKLESKKAEFLDKQRRALAGEVIEQEKPEVVRTKAAPAKPAKGTVLVDMRSDEVFGTVLLELMVA